MDSVKDSFVASDQYNFANKLYAYYKENFKLIFKFSLISCLIYFIILFFTPRKYIARETFVVQEKNLQAGGLASLAGQLGVDLSSSLNSGLFGTDNVILFLKSKKLIREVLLLPFDSSKLITVADRFYSLNPMNDFKFINPSKYKFEFNYNRPLNRVEDSVVNEMIDVILEKHLVVTKIDRKATFIQVDFVTKDENLSKYFCEELIRKAVRSYRISKLQIQQENIYRLEARADSIYMLLGNKSLNQLHYQQDLLDQNPGNKIQNYLLEIGSIDKNILGNIFIEVVKNLEFAKMTMSNETPVMQVVDTPILPLEYEKKNYIFKMIYTFLFSNIACFVVLLLINKKIVLNI